MKKYNGRIVMGIGICIIILSCCLIDFEKGKILSIVKLVPGISIATIGLIILEKTRNTSESEQDSS